MSRCKEAFRVNNKISKQLKRRKQRIQYRLRDMHWNEQDKPMFSASNIHYEIAERSRGLAYGGIGCVHLLARQTGLIQALNDRLTLLKRHVPYYESDHILNIAYNILCNGECLEDIEGLRNTTKYTWTPSGPGGFPILPRPETSAADS
jgi:hypothetical protein